MTGKWTTQRLARMYLGFEPLSALLRGEINITRTQFPSDFRVLSIEPAGPKRVLLTFTSRELPELPLGESPPVVDPYQFDFDLRKPARWSRLWVVS